MRPSLHRKKWFPGVCLALVASLIGGDLIGVAEGVAWAQEAQGPRRLALFVVPKSKSDETAALLLKGLFRTLADRLQAAGLERAVTGNAAALATVRTRVEDGRKALNANRWAEALQAFTEAEQALGGVLGVADRALVARVYKGLGVALAGLNRLEEARRAMHRSLAVYPNQDAASYAYSLDTRNLFSQVQREVQDLPNGAVVVSTTPANAEVYVDYEFRGFSPVRVAGLTAGDHLVTAYLEGYGAHGSFVTVRGGTDDRADVALVSSPSAAAVRANTQVALRAMDKGRPVDDAAAGLAAATEATDVVFVRVAQAPGGFVLSGFVRGPSGVKPVQATLQRDATLVQSAQSWLGDLVGVAVPAEALLPPLDAPAVAMPGPTGEVGVAPEGEGEEYVIDPNSPIFKDTGKKPEESGIVTKWWFWTAIGAVVGGAVALGVVLGRKSSEAASPEGKVEILLHRAP